MCILALTALTIYKKKEEMDPLYTKRIIDFFVKSISQLKEDSGGQRWNAICEDTAQLFLHLCRARKETVPYTQFQMWQLFFEPQESQNMLEVLCQTYSLQTILFTCLHALLDPSPVWWQTQFN
jgi:hypothetical protein